MQRIYDNNVVRITHFMKNFMMIDVQVAPNLNNFEHISLGTPTHEKISQILKHIDSYATPLVANNLRTDLDYYIYCHPITLEFALYIPDKDRHVDYLHYLIGTDSVDFLTVQQVIVSKMTRLNVDAPTAFIKMLHNVMFSYDREDIEESYPIFNANSQIPVMLPGEFNPIPYGKIVIDKCVQIHEREQGFHEYMKSVQGLLKFLAEQTDAVELNEECGDLDANIRRLTTLIQIKEQYVRSLFLLMNRTYQQFADAVSPSRLMFDTIISDLDSLQSKVELEMAELNRAYSLLNSRVILLISLINGQTPMVSYRTA